MLASIMADDETTQRKQHNGRFQKGQSGNPGGRPKMPREMKDAIQKRTPELMRALFELAAQNGDLRVKAVAIKELLDRGWGKSAQIVNAKIEGVDIAEAHLQALQEFTRSGNTAEQKAELVTLVAGATTTEH